MNLTTIFNSLQSFEKISEFIAENDTDDIIKTIAGGLNKDVSYTASLPMGGYSKGRTSGCYYYVLKDLKENASHYKWFYDKLEDKRSKEIFLNLMRYRIFPDIQYIKSACDKDHEQYFDPDIISCDKDEVFVDCGGFTGDTTESFIRNYKDYKHIYIYEPSAESFDTCRRAVEKYKNITIKPYGVGKREETSFFTQSGANSSFSVDKNDKDVIEVNITLLDADIKEPISFIKMDVEGYEIDALIGAKNHILNDNPKLAICAYHILSDIWEIPKLIYTINPNYCFYLRHYCDDHNWETVVYAIPKAEKKRADFSADKVQPGVYEMSGRGPFTDGQLTEHYGTIPFLFYKKFGFKAVIVSTKAGEYHCLDTYIKGTHMDIIPDDSIKTKCHYIIDHYRDMDVLILNGVNSQNFVILEAYRRLRPDGKVYLSIDANASGIDRIHWNNPDFLRFMDWCDVIATSSKPLQKYLSIKWPYKIEYIPNGYYNSFGCDLDDSLPEKENVILTVGGTGTKQKDNELLLEAYSKAYGKITDWSLKLVGGIESSFQDYIDHYFEKNPHLKHKVTFAGMTEDKKELQSEYQKAKLFVLPSAFEGFPDVVSEALFNGCYIVTSDSDASEDVTNHGSCGKAFRAGDIDQLARALEDVCNDRELISKGGRNALEYARRVYDLNKIADRLHYLLFAKE